MGRKQDSSEQEGSVVRYSYVRRSSLGRRKGGEASARAEQGPLFQMLRRIQIAVSIYIAMHSTPAVNAQDVNPAERPRPTMRATALQGAISLDGRLDEAIWASAHPATNFTQFQPTEGGPASERTEVKLVYGDGAIYVGARMFDSQPSSIGRQLVRRDGDGQFDWFAVLLDPNLDRRTGYLFRVSAANVQRDEFIFDDRERDGTFDAVWQSAVTVDAEGWNVEMRIPLNQLRFEASDTARVWGVNFARRILRLNEEVQFALVSRLQRGLVSQFGNLEDVQLSESPRRAELRPYVLGSAFRGPAEAGNPFQDGRDMGSRAGIDIRYGLGSQFTADVTLNPDFGQVESDPAIINLTAFENFFEERRPFFTEDAKIFDFTLSGGRNRLFYSRRIGRSPRGSAPSGAAFTDVPQAASILGAAKITGRTSRGLSLGILAAETQEEQGLALDSVTGQRLRYLAEPKGAFGVVRARQDYNDGASTIGALATTMHRWLPSDGSFRFLPSSAFSAGLDWEHQWNDRTWAFFGYAAGSRVVGDSVAMIRIQRSSTQFSQRPDARWGSLDSTATSLTGLDWRATLEKRRGTHWTGSVWAAQVTPGFEINDLGFTTRQEVLDGGVRISYREITPGKRFQQYNYSLSTFHNWSHDALSDPWSSRSWGTAHVGGSVSAHAEATLRNFWRIEGNLSASPERVDRSATRGGPLIVSPRSFNANINLQTDRRKFLSVQPSVRMERRQLNAGHEFEVGMDVVVRPSSRVELRVEPEWRREFSGTQYVATASSTAFAPTYGNRYLFGDLERREVAMETRLNVTMTPNLSLELFAQPLLSSGHFVSYKQLARPSSFDFSPYAEGTFSDTGGNTQCVGGTTCVSGDQRYFDFDNDQATDFSIRDQDFNVRSLIGNAVMRWEFKPGSTLFVVWQRRQNDRVIDGVFDFERDAKALFTTPAQNTFIVKLRYWFGL